MTLGEIKKLVEDFNDVQTKINKIRADKDLSSNQKEIRIRPHRQHLEELKRELKRYEKLFVIPASHLLPCLKDVFTEEKGIAYGDVDLYASVDETVTQRDDNDFFIASNRYHYQYDVDLILEYLNKQGDKTIEQKLLHICDFRTSRAYDSRYSTLEFEINLLSLLTKPNMKNAKLIHQACWDSVELKLRPMVEKKQEANAERVNLLLKKLELLQNEEKRRLAIESMTKQISELTDENETLDECYDSVVVPIDNI